jgi:hypothetical protein
MNGHAREAVDDDFEIITMLEQALQIHGFKVSAF